MTIYSVFPLKMVDLSIAMLVYQRVKHLNLIIPTKQKSSPIAPELLLSEERPASRKAPFGRPPSAPTVGPEEASPRRPVTRRLPRCESKKDPKNGYPGTLAFNGNLYGLYEMSWDLIKSNCI